MLCHWRTGFRSAAAWLLVVPALLFAAGVALPDLTLLCGGALLSARAFDAWMTLRGPWDAWRAAIHCVTAGLAFLVLGGLALLAGVLVSWWPVSSASSSAAVVVLAWALVAGIAARAVGVLERAIIAVTGTLALSLVAARWQAPPAAVQIASVCCGLVLLARGWHLLRHVCFALLQMDRRH